MTTQEWKSSGKYLNWKGFDVFYRDSEKSEKPVLLLLHGYPTASWDWWQIWQLLENDFRIIAFDFLGFGFSDKPTDFDYSIHSQADIAQHLLAEIGINTYHLIAHDYGVSVAQELLARKIEKNNTDLQSICFLNGGIFAEMHRPLLIQKLMLSPLRKIMPFFIGKKSLDKNFKKIFGPNTQASENELDEFWNLIQYNNGRKVIPLLITYMLDRKENRDRWCLPLIHPIIPIRLINGNKDPISGKHVGERYLELYPEADVINLIEIGHYPNVENPKDVVKHFLDFQNMTQVN